MFDFDAAFENIKTILQGGGVKTDGRAVINRLLGPTAAPVATQPFHTPEEVTNLGKMAEQQFRELLQNELFLLLMFGVFAYTAFSAVVIALLEVPPDVILDSGLKEILLVFEG